MKTTNLIVLKISNISFFLVASKLKKNKKIKHQKPMRSKNKHQRKKVEREHTKPVECTKEI